MKSIFLAILFDVCSMCKSQPCLMTETEPIKKTFEIGEKKTIEFHLRNNTSSSISLPEWLHEGTVEDEDSEYYLEVLRRNSEGEFENVGIDDKDYQYMVSNRKFQILKSGESIKYSASMDFLHDLTFKGAYRVRIVVKSQKLADCGKSVPSSWQDFEVR